MGRHTVHVTAGTITEVLPNTGTGTQAAPVAVDETEDTLIAAASNTRKYILLQNIGGQDVYFSLDAGAPVATSDGWLLAANGGSFEREAPGWVPQGAIDAICDTGLSSTVMVLDVDEA